VTTGLNGGIRAYKEVCDHRSRGSPRKGSPTVTDVLFLAILIAFFAIAVVFVHACDRIIGPDAESDAPTTASEPEQLAA
jgi:hypothetical protein